jgi:hypothetical protein
MAVIAMGHRASHPVPDRPSPKVLVSVPQFSYTVADYPRVAALRSSSSTLEHALAHQLGEAKRQLTVQGDSLARLRTALAALARLEVLYAAPVAGGPGRDGARSARP